ncbi:MAG TPA: hypothetical protein VK742_20280 [Candidatus Sulfotelmatobacter sp.]|jgi:hypothetical protein|nr:hypothetical protein [Candidatus Sulfotelmatobacter sp.]
MPKNNWKPNPEQRLVLLKLKAESGDNQNEFVRDFGNETIGTPSKLSQILDALDEDATSYFNKINDPETLMADVTEFVDDLPRQKREKFSVVETVIKPISYFVGAAKMARALKNVKTAERCFQYIGPTGASKSTLFPYLQKELKNDFTMGLVNCRDSWRPSSRDMRQRAKTVVLKDICDGLKIRIPEEYRQTRHGSGTDTKDQIKLDSVPAVEDMIVDFLQKRPYLIFLEEGRFLRTYALNLFIDLLNRSKLVLFITNTPIADKNMHAYCPDEADQLDRRTRAVIKITVINSEDAGLFFEADQFEDRDAALDIIARSASEFGHFSLINRVAKRLAKSTGATLVEVERAVEKSVLEMNRIKKFAPR